MQWIQAYLLALLDVWLQAAPWLLIGLLAAGLIHAFVPTDRMARWLGGSGPGASLKAAVIGTPLPLCSCSVLPAALAMRKQGASKPSTVSFLVATPENGADSIALSYALLGLPFAIARPIAAVISGVVAGVLTGWLSPGTDGGDAGEPAGGLADSKSPKAATATGCEPVSSALPAPPEPPAFPEPSARPAPAPHPCAGPATPGKLCCGPAASAVSHPETKPAGDEPKTAAATSNASPTGGGFNHAGAQPSPDTIGKLTAAVGYGFGPMLKGLMKWLLIGLALAALLNTLIDPGTLARYGQGPIAYALMLIVGVPMYICATASTPVAASLLMAGLSPGTILIFLLVGPATNLGSMVIVRQALGTRSLVSYLIGVALTALLAAIVVDGAGWLATDTISLTRTATDRHAHGAPLPAVDWVAGIVLAVAIVRLWVTQKSLTPKRVAQQRMTQNNPASCCATD